MAVWDARFKPSKGAAMSTFAVSLPVRRGRHRGRHHRLRSRAAGSDSEPGRVCARARQAVDVPRGAGRRPSPDAGARDEDRHVVDPTTGVEVEAPGQPVVKPDAPHRRPTAASPRPSARHAVRSRGAPVRTRASPPWMISLPSGSRPYRPRTADYRQRMSRFRSARHGSRRR